MTRQYNVGKHKRNRRGRRRGSYVEKERERIKLYPTSVGLFFFAFSARAPLSCTADNIRFKCLINHVTSLGVYLRLQFCGSYEMLLRPRRSVLEIARRTYKTTRHGPHVFIAIILKYYRACSGGGGINERKVSAHLIEKRIHFGTCPTAVAVAAARRRRRRFRYTSVLT